MEAYVTVVSDDDSALGAAVLAESLRGHTSRHLVALLTPHHVNPFSRQLLKEVFTHVYVASEFVGNDDLALNLGGCPEISASFTKLHCWRLTQYQKCVYLEADTLVLGNCDDLFSREELSAVPDVGWPDCFNAGVFVFRPSLNTFAQLLSLLGSQYYYQGGEQGLLNAYFKDWRNELSKRLPFVYNVFPTAHYTYAPALKNFSSAIKIVHFYKPWSAPWPEQGSAPPLTQFHMDTWATIFKDKIIPKLPHAAQQLVGSSRSGSATQLLQMIQQRPPPIFHRPSPIAEASHQQQPPSPPSLVLPASPLPPPSHSDDHLQTTDDGQQQTLNTQQQDSATEETFTYQPEPEQEQKQQQPPLDPHWEALLWDSVKTPWEPPEPLPVQDFQLSTAYQPEESTAEPTFGWFSTDSGAQEARSSSSLPPSSIPFSAEAKTESEEEKEEVSSDAETEDTSADRMKAWEEGNIDYLGRDKFDNIWRRLEQMLRDPNEVEEDEIEEEIEPGKEENAEEVTREEEEEVEKKEDEGNETESWAGYPEGDWSGMFEWQEGRIDYTGRDRSDNILKRLDLVISGGVVPYLTN